jgi:hypothetical protein
VDVIEYLWRDVERGQGNAILAQALNTPAVRDALLRHAAISNAWDQLRVASQAAADVAGQHGWSRSGPDAVVGICHWIAADRLLREVPSHDRAARLAGAVLDSWSNPQRVASAVAASDPLDPAAGKAFTDAVSADGVPGKAGEVLEEIAAASDDDPDLVAFACNTPQVRDALLRATARSGDWPDLAEAADAAADAARAAGTFDAGPRTVGAIARWMLGDPDGRLELHEFQQVDPLAAAVVSSGVDPLTAADGWAHAPRLAEDTARAFDAAINPPVGLGPVPDLDGDDPLAGDVGLLVETRKLLSEGDDPELR